jgi:hypothetical protein
VSGSVKRIALSANPSKASLSTLTGVTQPSLLGADNSNNSYQVFELQSQNNYTDGTVSFKVPLQVTGSVSVSGSSGIQVTGSVKQRFTAPGSETEIELITVNGAVVNGLSYDVTNFSFSDLASFGDEFKDAFVIESYDSLSYLRGAEFTLNGISVGSALQASGSGTSFQGPGYSENRLYASSGKSLLEQYASIINIGTFAPSTTDSITIGHKTLPVISIGSLKNEISGSTIISGSTQITGSVNISQVLKLAGQDPLPANGVGQLAVSGSNLYYNNGSAWTQIN